MDAVIAVVVTAEGAVIVIVEAVVDQIVKE